MTALPHLKKWMSLAPVERNVFLPHRGETLFLQGQPSDYFYVVMEGRILFTKESHTGNPLILERLLPGDCVAPFAILFDFPYPASALSDCPSRVVGYSKKTFHVALEKDPELRREVNIDLGQRFKMYQFRLLYANTPIEVRLSHVLLFLSGREYSSGITFSSAHDVCETCGVMNPPVITSISRSSPTFQDSVTITRAILAQMCMTTVETAIRITRSWEKAGKVDLSKRGKIRILDPDFFRKIIEGNAR
jgi:CRP-like cAMP-binding protein